MKKSIDEHASRFDAKAEGYDDRDRPVYAACADRVIDAVNPSPDDIILDLGTGTGAIALPLARSARRVVGRDISEEMLAQARRKARESGVMNVEFGRGSFRAPRFDGTPDVITTNYALHHLDDDAKREAIHLAASFHPRRFVLGDVMLFAESDPADPAFSPEVDDPATVGVLVSALTDAGFEITRVDSVTDQAGVIVSDAPRAGWDQ